MPALERGHKVVLFGSISVGKSTLLIRITDDRFDPNAEPTACAGHADYRPPRQDSVVIQFWDTAGMERYRSVNWMYYHDAIAALLAFDLSRRKSFGDCSGWLDEFQKANTQTNPIIILVGNKCDLQPEVTEEEARAWAAAHAITYFPVSALSGEGVVELLDGLVSALPNPGQRPQLKQIADEEHEEPSRCC
jgi:small GTP-binding protein